MKTYTSDEIKEIIKNHKRYLDGEAGGVKADLRYANLCYADLRYADLRYANLCYADLRYADLRSADLRSADLRSADLRYADLRYADLRSADLCSAKLSISVARLDFGGWSICVRHDRTSIGCQMYGNEEWLEWTPEDIASFDRNAADWWRIHGDAVKAVIRCVMAKHALLTENAAEKESEKQSE